MTSNETMKPAESRIGLGTVQFGLDYGVSNSSGRVSEDEIRGILETAWNSGVRTLDTAAAYGTSEEALGKTIPPGRDFKIVTKIPKIPVELKPGDVEPFVRQTFEQSLRKLRVKSVHGLMFHHADDLIGGNAEEAYAAVSSLRKSGLVEKIGVSAYDRFQLERIGRRFRYDLVQVPVNVLDQRLVKSGCLRKLHDDGVEIHARSAFLQGLLLMDPDTLKPYFDPVRETLRAFHAEAGRLGVTPLKMALTYVDRIDMISRIVVGVTRETELREILDALREPIQVDFDRFAVDDEAMVNPARWI